MFRAIASNTHTNLILNTKQDDLPPLIPYLLKTLPLFVNCIYAMLACPVELA
jgi:hypothetical protein